MLEALPEKRCFKCGEVKLLSDFYKHPQMLDGHVNKCKECNKKDVIENRLKRVEYYKAYDRVRTSLPHRKQANRDYSKRDYVKTDLRKRNNRYKEEYPERHSARIAVNNAVRDGRLYKLPCWTCGSLEVEAHHPDYDSPLDVIWLCTKHHAEVHRDYDRTADEELLAATTKGSRYDK
jgi:CRISPR/Cas system CMR-associated protein Cmr3 (group 5 of RAMP superfamily)